jgi:hypothetical protein
LIAESQGIPLSMSRWRKADCMVGCKKMKILMQRKSAKMDQRKDKIQ